MLQFTYRISCHSFHGAHPKCMVLCNRYFICCMPFRKLLWTNIENGLPLRPKMSIFAKVFSKLELNVSPTHPLFYLMEHWFCVIIICFKVEIGWEINLTRSGTGLELVTKQKSKYRKFNPEKLKDFNALFQTDLEHSLHLWY